MAYVTIEFDSAKFMNRLKDMKVKSKELPKKIVTEGGSIAVRKYKDRVPVKTRKLRDSMGNPSNDGIWIETQLDNGYQLEFGTKVKYAYIIERGFASHLIIAKGKALKFTGKDGQVHFAKSAVHPGYQGKYAFLTSIMEMKRELDTKIISEMKNL
jgi:hypothetical protein